MIDCAPRMRHQHRQGGDYALTLGLALRRLAREAPRAELLVCSGERVTAAEADRDADRLASTLLARGVRPGERVAVWLSNGGAWLIALFGIARIGTVVPLNLRYRADEILAVLARSRASALVTVDDDERRREVLADVASRLPELRVVDPRHLDAAGAAPQGRVEPDDVALIQFTSGTTAAPKGVQLGHEQILRNAWELGRRLDVRKGDRYASGMPMYHVGGSVLSATLAVVREATLITQPRFDPSDMIRLIGAERCTHLFGIETMFAELLEQPDLERADLGSLRVCFAGGRPSLLAAVRRRICRTVVNRYGLTEASGNVTCTEVTDPPEVQLHSAGRPLPGLEVRVADPSTGRVLPPGGEGTIEVRGWAVMRGYLDDASATRAAISADGWLGTRDLGVLSGDGRLRFVGRARETIRIGGENVAPAEIEELLGRHPAVAQAAVVPLEDRRLGEVPVAFVELRRGARAGERELIDFCRERAAGFKAPRQVRFVEPGAWPLTESGKIRKVVLREAVRSSEILT